MLTIGCPCSDYQLYLFSLQFILIFIFQHPKVLSSNSHLNFLVWCLSLTVYLSTEIAQEPVWIEEEQSNRPEISPADIFQALLALFQYESQVLSVVLYFLQFLYDMGLYFHNKFNNEQVLLLYVFFFLNNVFL